MSHRPRTPHRSWRSFTQARAFVQALHFPTRAAWDTYCQSGKKPDDIPANPRLVYPRAFRDWNDW